MRRPGRAGAGRRHTKMARPLLFLAAAIGSAAAATHQVVRVKDGRLGGAFVGSHTSQLAAVIVRCGPPSPPGPRMPLLRALTRRVICAGLAETAKMLVAGDGCVLWSVSMWFRGHYSSVVDN